MKICIISEGSYPIVRGGVSEWTQQLIKELHFVDFDIFCLAPTGQETWLAEYEKPANVKAASRQEIRGASESNFRRAGRLHGRRPEWNAH